MQVCFQQKKSFVILLPAAKWIIMYPSGKSLKIGKTLLKKTNYDFIKKFIVKKQ